ncbi:MAG TPA: DNA polymerase IV [Actinomycetota bacterium]|nr:DNA polymerase IV [Actinomycetota bacterium]
MDNEVQPNEVQPNEVQPLAILHVDMDAFYASVEVIKDPALRGKPVIVGGQGGRGVVTSASYEARAFGITSAMPMLRARRLCPQAVFVPNDFSAYQRYSELIRDVFISFTPVVEPMSLDEAFLDVSGALKLFGDPVTIAGAIKRDIAGLGLSCTVGVAPNKFLAKLASAAGKPDGLLVVPPDGVEAWLHPMPVRALWGVGQRTGEMLQRLGLRTIGDLAVVPRATLQRALGDAAGAHLHDLANGRDDRPVVPSQEAKSVGAEETFARDLDTLDAVVREVLRLSDRVAGRLRAKGLCGRCVTLKIRFGDFRTITRSLTSPDEIDNAAEIFEIAKALIEKVHKAERIGRSSARIRLAGVSVSSLAPGPARRQLDLLEERGSKGGWPEASDAIDRIRQRWGGDAVTPAALIDP